MTHKMDNFILLVALIYLIIYNTTQAQEASRKNVLFLVADDMRTNLGCYEESNTGFSSPKMFTPNLDSLASRSLLLEKAYVQQAICGPSRASILTGRRPDTTHVLDLNSYFREVGGNFTTIPQFFKNKGYKSIGIGKIFHPSVASGNDDPPSWSEPSYHAHNYYPGGGNSWMSLTPHQMATKPPRTTVEADYAITKLQELAPDAILGIQPFFLAYGAQKPHLPWVFPRFALTHYPTEDIKVPENHYAPSDMPDMAWSNWKELRNYKDCSNDAIGNEDLGMVNVTLPEDKVRELRRAYYSAITYADHELGRVLDELSSLGLAENTVVVFWSDHGWQLGEHAEWAKHTNFEIAARAPLMVHIPGLTDNGIKTGQLAEFVDIFPTLVEAAGFEALENCPINSNEIMLCTEGSSLLPLMMDPSTPDWKEAVFWQYPRGNFVDHISECMGYSMRTARFHYTEWVHITRLGDHNYQPDWEKICDWPELYDMDTDPEENVNIARKDEYKDVAEEMSKRLRAGWRQEIK